MENTIIIVIIIILIILAFIPTVKHFKGKGGCCGGGSAYKSPKKKLKNVIYTKTYTVEGMNCQNCKARVEEKINDISGISGKVYLKHGKLTVKFSKDISDEVIASAVEKAGYKLR